MIWKRYNHSDNDLNPNNVKDVSHMTTAVCSFGLNQSIKDFSLL